MNYERILRFCEKQMEQEKAKGSLSSEDKVKAYMEVLDFINNSDKPKGSEVKQICDVFEKHYVAYVRSITKSDSPLRYSFKRADEDFVIPRLLIPAIKAEIGNNENEFKDVTVVQYFDFFMEHLPSWWKQHQFSVSAITKHFQAILGQIVIKNHVPKHQLSNGSANQKATMADVLDDLKEEARNVK